jgi:hypothetical protein
MVLRGTQGSTGHSNRRVHRSCASLRFWSFSTLAGRRHILAPHHADLAGSFMAVAPYRTRTSTTQTQLIHSIYAVVRRVSSTTIALIIQAACLFTLDAFSPLPPFSTSGRRLVLFLSPSQLRSTTGRKASLHPSGYTSYSYLHSADRSRERSTRLHPSQAGWRSRTTGCKQHQCTGHTAGV